MTDDPRSQAFFDDKYQQASDPWNFAASPYEQGRYAATVEALGKRRFARAFEPGCSIGVLTQRLAKLCDRVEAIEISPTAVKQAQDRCRFYPNVHIRQGALPDAIPSGEFDLIVFSEIGYYFEPATLNELTAALVDRIKCTGTFLAVHWLGNSPDHLLTGDQVHDVLAQVPKLQHADSQRYEGFRLDRWTRL